MRNFLLIWLPWWYGAFATVIVTGLSYLARKDRGLTQLLYDRIAELEEELHLWREEAAELEDEEKSERFDRALRRLVKDLDEKTAERIVEALDAQALLFAEEGDESASSDHLADARAIILRELVAAWSVEPVPAQEGVADGENS